MAEDAAELGGNRARGSARDLCVEILKVIEQHLNGKSRAVLSRYWMCTAPRLEDTDAHFKANVEKVVCVLVEARDTAKDLECSPASDPAPWCPASLYYSSTPASVWQWEFEDPEDNVSLTKQQKREQSPYHMSCTYISGYEPERIQGALFGSPDGPHLQSELDNAQTSEQVHGRTRKHHS